MVEAESSFCWFLDVHLDNISMMYSVQSDMKYVNVQVQFADTVP